MIAYIRELLSSNQLAPHGYCLLWRPELIWTHVFSDLAIGLSYISIAIGLTLFVRRRTDVAFGWIFWAFAAFILLCGATHLFSIWTLWHPDYGIEALIKLATAIASAMTAVALWPLIPKALAIPSPAQLQLANDALSREIVEREAAEAMLRQAQKLEVVGQLTGGVAHDFNNLLTVISGNVELAGRAIASGTEGARAKIERYLEHAGRGVDQAKTLTSRLLAFSRRQTLDPQVTDVGALVGNMAELLVRTLGEAITVKFVAAPDTCPVEIDRNQLENAVLNLAVNARDAMTADTIAAGALTIEIENAELDEAYVALHSDLVAGRYVAISVSDTGTGMTPEVVERAFEPFFTTKDVGRGTGLGLSQVFGFVKQSGGHVKVYSEPGHGTTVRLYLPCVAGERALDTGTSPTQPEPLRGNGERILVVEDDAAVRSFVVESLESLGYVVDHADGGEHALAMIAEGVTPDLLLSDVVMAGMNGRAVADAVQALRPGLPVVFMTGYARNAISHGGRLDPGVRVITKPFTLAALAAKLREALADG